MKKVFLLLTVALCLISCGNGKKTINSRELEGLYEVDFSEVLNQYVGDNEYVHSLATALLSKVKMTMLFEDGVLIIDGTDFARGMINAFGEMEKLPFVVDYKIQDDSVLCTRQGNEPYEPSAVLRKLSSSYDYLQLLPIEPDEYSLVVTLRKQERKKK